MKGTLLLSLLPFVLSSCSIGSGRGYSAVIEGSDSVPGTPTSNKAHWVGVIGNTGKDIPQLFVSVDTGGTLQRISARAFMQVDTNLQGSTFGTGGYYLPPLLMKPLEGGASFNRAVWNLGDLPHGYAMVLTVRFRAVPTVIRQPHVSVKWYVSRTDHTLLRDATLLTGEIDQF